MKTPLWKSPVLLAALAAGPLLLFGWYVSAFRSSPELLDTDPTVSRNRTREVGGIQRPLSDITVNSVRRSARDEMDLRSSVEYSRTFGLVTCPKTPVMTPRVNPQMDSVIEAVEKREHFERISPWVKPTAFDAELWKKDSSVYLSVAEPGRVFEVAQPAEGVAPLTNASSVYGELREGELVRVSAKTTPNSPVTFTLFGNGKFDNGIGTVTVAADDQGVATTVYVGTTSARAEVLAGSPTSSGTVRYRFNVLPAIP